MRPENLKVLDGANYVSASADRQLASVDMANAEWVMAIVKFATIAAGAVTSLKWQQSSDNGSADDWTDLEGTSISVAADDDDQVFVKVLCQPRKRYVRLYIDKDATNAVAESAVYVVGGNRTQPALANITDDVTVEVEYSPAEGTA